MSIFERRRYEVPGLNTASLPDLIFTVLSVWSIISRSSIPSGLKRKAGIFCMMRSLKGVCMFMTRNGICS